MTNILEILKSGVTDLTLNIKGEDLLTFADSLIAKAKEQLLPVMVSAAKEQLLSKKEVLEKIQRLPDNPVELVKKRLSRSRQNRSESKLPSGRHRTSNH